MSLTRLSCLRCCCRRRNGLLHVDAVARRSLCLQLSFTHSVFSYAASLHLVFNALFGSLFCALSYPFSVSCHVRSMSLPCRSVSRALLALCLSALFALCLVPCSLYLVPCRSLSRALLLCASNTAGCGQADACCVFRRGARPTLTTPQSKTS